MFSWVNIIAIAYCVPVTCGGAARMLDCQSRGTGFESTCPFETWAVSFTPHYLSSHSCINEYLAIDSGGCCNE